MGTYSRDRDVSVHAVYDHGYWRVQHTLSNGHVYDRGVQYSINDARARGASIFFQLLEADGAGSVSF